MNQHHESSILAWRRAIRTICGFLTAVAIFPGHLAVGGYSSPKSGAGDEWEAAAKKIKRLRPSAFRQLPVSHRRRLEALGCTIPQVPGITQPHNVVVGEFAKAGQTDWAVVCSRMGSSTVLVLWGGPVRCPSELGSANDKFALQGMGEGKIKFSRMISPVDKKYIVDHKQAYGGPRPPPIEHQGIDDVFVGKASVVNYCHQGKWLQLQGAD